MQEFSLNKVFMLQIFMIVNCIYLLSIGLVTLPLYSLAVQMGGDFKPDLLAQNPATSASMTSEANFVHQRHVRPSPLCKADSLQRDVQPFFGHLTA